MVEPMSVDSPSWPCGAAAQEMVLVSQDLLQRIFGFTTLHERRAGWAMQVGRTQPRAPDRCPAIETARELHEQSVGGALCDLQTSLPAAARRCLLPAPAAAGAFKSLPKCTCQA